MKNNIIFFLALLLISPLTSSSHWIVGYVNDAADATSPNARIVKLYNTANLEEIFSIIGPSGPSATSNIYMIDCEMLQAPCVTGDVLNITLVEDGTGHVAIWEAQVTVSNAGFDMAPNISMNSPIIISFLEVEDAYTSPQNEIDLTPNATTKVICSAILTDYDQSTSILSAMAKFYNTNPADSDDNNNHYTNNSCQLDTSYGTSLEAQVNCTFHVEYYANSDSWQCQINATDSSSISTLETDQTFINPLLSIGANSLLDFGEINPQELTPEETIEITNYGNVKINLSLSGYGETLGDGNAMECSGKNISIENAKYNLAASNPGEITLSQAETLYSNLTTNPIIREFNLKSRQNDMVDDAKNNTYWRVYVPRDVGLSCQGNIVLGATQN